METGGIMTRRKTTIWGLATAICAIALASTTTALAANQGHSSDGSPAIAAAPPPAPATVSCTTSLFSIVRTQPAADTTISTTFVAVPGATATFTIPSGQTRCVKVLFTGETSCVQSAAQDFCYVRAMNNAVEMPPAGATFQAIDSEHSTGQAHAYEWVSRMTAGSHTITLQRRVGNISTTFALDDWTFDVQVYN
jgi:hypothetical protein